jgi:hypothetical protein
MVLFPAPGGGHVEGREVAGAVLDVDGPVDGDALDGVPGARVAGLDMLGDVGGGQVADLAVGVDDAQAAVVQVVGDGPALPVQDVEGAVDLPSHHLVADAGGGAVQWEVDAVSLDLPGGDELVADRGGEPGGGRVGAGDGDRVLAFDQVGGRATGGFGDRLVHRGGVDDPAVSVVLLQRAQVPVP